MGLTRTRLSRTAKRVTAIAVAFLLSGHATVASRATQAAKAPAGPDKAAALKIVVVAGEDAVNIIQQKTAVAPVVEVRDRNDQPVSGAVVQFAIRGGRATFNGARALSVTTDALGRAAVTGLTPTSGGAFQITASAAFQGQTAVATIAQTNVLTAAQAASVAGTGGAGGGAGGGSVAGAGGAAGGGAGGLSATTIAIVGGAAAGGALAATKALGGGDQATTYRGTFSGALPVFFGPTCQVDLREDGTVTLEINVSDSGAVTGQGHVSATNSAPVGPLPATCPAGLTSRPPEQHGSDDSQVSGTKSSLGFSSSHPGNAGTNWTYAFTGAFNGAEIVGTFTQTVTTPGTPDAIGRFPVTLR